MSKPTAYMPLYFRDFLEACNNLRLNARWAYLCALCHNWGHNGCVGLIDDDEILRQICHVDPEDWPSVRDALFTGNEFFTLGEDGLWHQKRQDQEWLKTNNAYQAKINGGNNRTKRLSPVQRSAIATAAAKARWEKNNAHAT